MNLLSVLSAIAASCPIVNRLLHRDEPFCVGDASVMICSKLTIHAAITTLSGYRPMICRWMYSPYTSILTDKRSGCCCCSAPASHAGRSMQLPGLVNRRSRRPDTIVLNTCAPTHLAESWKMHIADTNHINSLRVTTKIGIRMKTLDLDMVGHSL